MAIVSRLTSNGILQVNGNFDEFTGSPVADSSLVLWLDAAQPSSYSGTGVTWNNLAVASNTATLINGPAFNTGRGGQFIFDGVDDYVSFNAPNLTTSVTTATVEMWVKINNTGARMPFGFSGYDVYMDGGHIGYNTGNSDSYGISAANVRSLGIVGNMKHIVFVMTNNTSLNSNPYTGSKIYINGVSQPLTQNLSLQGITNRNFSNGVGVISGWTSDLSYKATMDLSVFKIYNRELTNNEITLNYNTLAGRYGLPITTAVPVIQRTTSNVIFAEEFDEVTYNTRSPAIKNLFKYTETFNFDYTNWTLNGGTMTQNATLAPDGRSLAPKLVELASLGNQRIYNWMPVTAGTTYTYSIFLKAAERYIVRCYFEDVQTGGGGRVGQYLNLQTGTVISTYQTGSNTLLSSNLQNVGNGWYRFSWTVTAQLSAALNSTAFMIIGMADGGSNFNYTGDGTSGMFIWGAQMEVSPAATIYQGIAGPSTLITTGIGQRVDSMGNMFVSNEFDEYNPIECIKIIM